MIVLAVVLGALICAFSGAGIMLEWVVFRVARRSNRLTEDAS